MLTILFIVFIPLMLYIAAAIFFSTATVIVEAADSVFVSICKLLGKEV